MLTVISTDTQTHCVKIERIRLFVRIAPEWWLTRLPSDTHRQSSTTNPCVVPIMTTQVYGVSVDVGEQGDGCYDQICLTQVLVTFTQVEMCAA